MITEAPRRMEPPDWRRELRDAWTRPADLLAWLGLTPAAVDLSAAAAAGFPLRVPRHYAGRMRRGDATDPLLRQVLPVVAEESGGPGDRLDPVGDLASAQAPGLLRKYRGRALLVTTGACAVHCRYCFRRHFPYGEHNPAADGYAGALAALAADPSLDEVILSGGDPLVLDDRRLAGLARALGAIPHLRRLRIHSRVPIVLPARVDGALLDWLGASRLRIVVVVHANHPRDVDADVAAALLDLRAAGATVLNQSVLLRGINDDADVLAALSERLADAGALPYYLHALDRVRGAAHFEVPDDEARALVAAVRDRLPGYLVPRLVREVEGAASKIPV